MPPPALRRIGQARVGAPLELPEVEAVEREQEHHRREPEVGGATLLAIALHLSDAGDAVEEGYRQEVGGEMRRHGMEEALSAAHGREPEPSPTSVARPPASVVSLAPGGTPRAPLVSRHNAAATARGSIFLMRHQSVSRVVWWISRW